MPLYQINVGALPRTGRELGGSDWRLVAGESQNNSRGPRVADSPGPRFPGFPTVLRLGLRLKITICTASVGLHEQLTLIEKLAQRLRRAR